MALSIETEIAGCSGGERRQVTDLVWDREQHSAEHQMPQCGTALPSPAIGSPARRAPAFPLTPLDLLAAKVEYHRLDGSNTQAGDLSSWRAAGR